MGDIVITNFNADLLAVGIAAAAMSLLGFLVYFSNPRSVTNLTFFLFSLATVCWGASNFFEYKFQTISAALIALRLHLFISVWHALLFFQLCYIFPEVAVRFPRWYKYLLVPFASFVAVLTLTPFVFSGITVLAPMGHVTNPNRGPGIVIFILTAFGLLIGGLAVLYMRFYKSAGTARWQLGTMLAAMLSLAILILIFNVVLPVIFNVLLFIPFAALFAFPFIAFLSYAIYRLHLFNLKLIATGTLIFCLAAITFVEIVFTTTLTLMLFRTGILILVLATGIVLARSVLREIEQRELIEQQEKELEIANRAQENLIHFISHEVKGYLAKSEAAFAGILEGDYGPVSSDLKSMVTMALGEMKKGVEVVMDILHAGDFKKGTIAFHMTPFDFKGTLESLFNDFKPEAKERGLNLNLSITPGNYVIKGDASQLSKHVIHNLIDNAIKYTLKGDVNVTLQEKGDRILFSVKDSGVGITPEDKARLFTEGGRGKDSMRVNSHSTGYGLYIAKSIVVAHGGRIWAESEGANMGSTFFAELPKNPPAPPAPAEAAPSAPVPSATATQTPAPSA